MVIITSANPNIAFYNQSINFNINVTPALTGTVNYTFNFGDGQSLTTTASSASHKFLIKPYLHTYGSFSASDGSTGTAILSPALTINPLPIIDIEGVPSISNNITFSISNSASFITSAIDSVTWNFGDGNLSASLDISSTPIHSYSAVGSYIVYTSAIDISANYGVGSYNVGIFESDTCVTKQDYIQLGGPVQVSRFGPNKRINLTYFLPQYVQQTDTSAFLEVFENYLNNMFEGEDGFNLSAEDLTIIKNYITSGVTDAGVGFRDFTYDLGTSSTSAISSDTYDNAQKIITSLPSNYLDEDKKISILEKIKRLTELQDIDLIPIKIETDSNYSNYDFISLFAKNLGYQVDVSRESLAYTGEIGNLATLEDNTMSAIDIVKYLRFAIASLPDWYKIKTTDNAIKVMLYSFGLIGELNPFYTEDYIYNWILYIPSQGLSKIPDNYYASPHFAVEIDVDASEGRISFDNQRRSNVIKAINSVRPINTVFEKLSGYFLRELPTINMFMTIRMSKNIRIT